MAETQKIGGSDTKMTGLVPRKVRSAGVVKLKLVPGVRRKIRGRVGIVKLERVQVMCPACGLRVEAVARHGRVKGYCAVARQYVNFDTGRDSKGHFMKGNVPLNKKQ